MFYARMMLMMADYHLHDSQDYSKLYPLPFQALIISHHYSL